MDRVLLRGNYVHFSNKSSCCCSDNPAFSLVSKLHVLLKITRVTVLNKLSYNNDVIVKPADKRGATATLNICGHIIEGKRQLSNEEYYGQNQQTTYPSSKKNVIKAHSNFSGVVIPPKME